MNGVSTGNHVFTGKPIRSLMERINHFKATISEDHKSPRPVKEMVIVFTHGHHYMESPRFALMVKKRAGTLHAGLWNLPGGKLNPGETPVAAALRELKEETGVIGTFPQIVGAILPGKMDETDIALGTKEPFIVYIIRCIGGTKDSPTAPHDQPASWRLISDAHLTPVYVQNLAVILPLLASEIKNFVIEDEDWSGAYGKGSRIKTSTTRVTIYPEAGLPKKKLRFTT